MNTMNTSNLTVELKRSLEAIEARLQQLRKPMAVERKQARIEELARLIEMPDFWSDQKHAGEVQKEKTGLEKELARYKQAVSNLSDTRELLEMAEEDPTSLQELAQDVQTLDKVVHDIEMEQMLSGEHDRSNAIVSINVGQGGVDSQDFAEMLLRMYKRYAERRGYSVELMDYQAGEEAGIKSATILVSGEYAYGYLKAEVGVHRLVRISPFDSNARRHTSFASVWVLPEIDDSFEVDIKPEDLRIDTFRAGGAGGQHVNKTESAIRITHIPTGIAVACQQERSQQKNRSTAMKLLRAKLYDLEMKKRLAQKDKAEAAKLEASFGSQIRNYVLAPYRLAKDLRSGHEVGNVDAVLDGDLQSFIEAYLLHLQNA